MTSLRLTLAAFLGLFLLPLAVHAAYWLSVDEGHSWRRANWASAGLLPAAHAQPEAMVNVYAARTGRWKGIFADHCWIVLKERGAAAYTRYDKVAWGRPVHVNAWAPDAHWYGHRPVLVASIAGAEAERLIPRIKAAVAAYPYARPGGYRVWPGPNSNTFVAHVLASVPEAQVALPPTAVGKDFRPIAQAVGLTPSQTGLQVTLGGLLGVSVGWVEGIEVNILGLVAGIDLRVPALKLPGFGRLGLWPAAEATPTPAR
ncbi:MAG: DUF3750 domain-containing protein [Hyphomicrobiaceae bacterium]|nr:DUF3750 domain-containing protein [Hyphomicrobiaceae bacterium]